MAQSSVSAAHAAPNVQLWEKLYRVQKDVWTSDEADTELIKFGDILTDGATALNILVPLCGRTKVLLWFAEKGHRVVGIEWSEIAVKKFFEENGLAHTVKSCTFGGSNMQQFTATDKAITVYCGDYFAFEGHDLDLFDRIFDHGSIGSFLGEKRTKYVEIVNSFLKPGGRMLLSAFDYDHSEHPSIPFAVTEEEVDTLYKNSFSHPKVLKEFDAERTDEIFAMRKKEDMIFPVWTFSRFSWKVYLLIKL